MRLGRAGVGPTDRPTRSFVEQVLFPQLKKFVERFLPVFGNAPRILSLNNRVIDGLIQQQLDHSLHVELLRIELVQGRCQFDPQLGSIESIAPNQSDTGLPGTFRPDTRWPWE